MLQAELAHYNFEKEVEAEREQKLIEDTFAEVEKKQSFYLDIQTNKVETNKDVFKTWSPGNKFYQPPVGAPHEGVHPQEYWDTETLTEDKM